MEEVFGSSRSVTRGSTYNFQYSRSVNGSFDIGIGKFTSSHQSIFEMGSLKNREHEVTAFGGSNWTTLRIVSSDERSVHLRRGTVTAGEGGATRELGRDTQERSAAGFESETVK